MEWPPHACHVNKYTLTLGRQCFQYHNLYTTREERGKVREGRREGEKEGDCEKGKRREEKGREGGKERDCNLEERGTIGR